MFLRSTLGTNVMNNLWGATTHLHTSSADSMQRGSSRSMGHWCNAATVNGASRFAFGKQLSSNSTMAPPASSNNHATVTLNQENFFGKREGRETYCIPLANRRTSIRFHG